MKSYVTYRMVAFPVILYPQTIIAQLQLLLSDFPENFNWVLWLHYCTIVTKKPRI